MNWPKNDGFYPYSPATLLKVTGSDAAGYLQGQFTNELRGLRAGSAVYGLWLNQKGKVLADSFIHGSATEGEFFVMSYFSGTRVIRERLEAYVIADDVVVEDITSEWSGVSLGGANSRDLLPRLPGGGLSFQGRRMNSGGWELLFPKTAATEIRAALSAAGRAEISALEMERLRIAEGIPAVPQDIGPGELPNEGGLETTAISYTKGCYLGQEVMARLKSMGQVRRRLLRVEGHAESLPPLPAPLFLAGRKIGELRSGIPDGDGGFAGLALLTLMQMKPDTVLSFAPDEPPRARVMPAVLLS